MALNSLRRSRLGTTRHRRRPRDRPRISRRPDRPSRLKPLVVALTVDPAARPRRSLHDRVDLPGEPAHRRAEHAARAGARAWRRRHLRPRRDGRSSRRSISCRSSSCSWRRRSRRSIPALEESALASGAGCRPSSGESACRSSGPRSFAVRAARRHTGARGASRCPRCSASRVASGSSRPGSGASLNAYPADFGAAGAYAVSLLAADSASASSCSPGSRARRGSSRR